MKILFVFTGGTISTTLTDSVMKVDKNKPYALISAYKSKFGIDFEYDCISPYLELSENCKGVHLDKLCSCIKERLNEDYDGIIVTHGTDTLQYSAAALSYCVGSQSIPVCIVSASYPIEDEISNALDNLHGAVLLIKNKLGKGVLVPFRNTKDSKIKVHIGTRLLSSIAFSDEVLSANDGLYGVFDSTFTFTKNKDLPTSSDAIAPFDPCFSLSSPVLFINAHVGMNYPVLSQNVRYVLISSYHSGTVDTKSESAKKFYATAKDMGIKVFISGVSKGNVYESTTVFSDFSITPLPDIAPISAYIKLWLISNVGENADKVFLPLGNDL